MPPKAAEPEDKEEIVVVLEGANLEVVKLGDSYELLNCDDHQHILRKHKRDPATARPDICHQATGAQVYVHTNKNVLIKVHKSIRIPRTFRRFSGLMVQLLHKMSIRATNGPHKLLEVIRNPIVSHLPPNAKCIGTSSTAEVVNVRTFVSELPADRPVVFVYGAMAHGKAECEEYVEEWISVSNYPLSGATAVARLLSVLEEKYEIE